MERMPQKESDVLAPEAPQLPNLFEIINLEQLNDKWEAILNILKEPLEQKHLLSPASLDEINLPHQDWHLPNISDDAVINRSTGEKFYFCGRGKRLIARIKSAVDEFGQLTAEMEANYHNPQSEPYSVSNPFHIKAYTWEYGLGEASSGIAKGTYTEYNHEESKQEIIQEVSTYWIQPPIRPHASNAGRLAKNLATRNIYMKYVNKQAVSAAIMEYDSIRSPQPSLGPGFILRRRVGANFENNQIVKIAAFERSASHDELANLTIIREENGELKQITE